MPPPTATLSKEEIDGIVNRRHASLLEKYIHGKTIPKEEAEIAHIIALLPKVEPPAPQTASPAAPALELEAETPGNAKRRSGYLHELTVYAERYDANLRTVKRWVSDGRSATPPDPCPLDQPAQMPEWWARNKTQRVPPAILAAASEAQRRPATSETALSSNVPPRQPENIAPAAGNTIDLATIETPEGAALQQARVFVAATYQKLNAAYTAGNDDEIRLWQPRWEKATETLRKAESEDRAAKKHRGDLLPRADVMADLSQLLMALKIMRASMAKRILARLPTVPPEYTDQIRTAVEIEREREDDVLRNLQTLRTPAEAGDRFELEAA